ncbi:hypothetical protein Cme02nite_57140 [Catellatospora methionotrophica]|uniref:Uncharacterized protein n=1 Tax=Catellatospora methionotrophica TaxID=121620 RepID=A0A8J3LAJ0_9ACTN|nr:hypothetical protein Cme02nite_57140 [Catellatospora methionotrophica]
MRPVEFHQFSERKGTFTTVCHVRPVEFHQFSERKGTFTTVCVAEGALLDLVGHRVASGARRAAACTSAGPW